MSGSVMQLFTMGSAVLRVFDDVLPDLASYTAAIRALPRHTITLEHVVFHGITECHDGTLARFIKARFPYATPTLSFFRHSPAGQIEPNYVHTDVDMGDWTGILYLTEAPREGDGTIFWRNRLTGATASTATTDAERNAECLAWRQDAQWEAWQHIEAVPNRLLLFPAALYHSRAIRENYGEGPTARLVQVIFGGGTLNLQQNPNPQQRV